MPAVLTLLSQNILLGLHKNPLKESDSPLANSSLPSEPPSGGYLPAAMAAQAVRQGKAISIPILYGSYAVLILRPGALSAD